MGLLLQIAQRLESERMLARGDRGLASGDRLPANRPTQQADGCRIAKAAAR